MVSVWCSLRIALYRSSIDLIWSSVTLEIFESNVAVSPLYVDPRPHIILSPQKLCECSLLVVEAKGQRGSCSDRRTKVRLPLRLNGSIKISRKEHHKLLQQQSTLESLVE